MKKAQSGTKVPPAKIKKNIKDATQMKNMRPTGPSTGRVKPTIGKAKTGTVIKKAQTGINAQKTRKTSAMREYVDKYKDKGGLGDRYNIANDTIAGNSPANQQYSPGYTFQRGNQINDLQKAFDKKYKGKLDIPVDKNGGKVITKAKSGSTVKKCKYGCK